MPQQIPYLLKTSALAVWSAVLLYLCFSNQLSYFLAPVFRNLVWFAGFTLAAITFAYAMYARPGSRCAELECEHHHEDHSHVQWTAFFVLIVPVCTALWINPQTYSKLAFDNRGMDGGTPQSALWEDDAAAATAAVSADPNVDPNYSQYVTSADGQADPAAPAIAIGDPPLPGTAPAPVVADDSTSQSKNIVDQMPKDAQGYTLLETSDLVYAANEPSFRAALQGRKIAMTGQYYPGTTDNAKRLGDNLRPMGSEGAPASSDFFWAVRMSMVCCAADARPSAVKVIRDASTPAPAGFKELDWVTTQGIVDFRRIPPSDQFPGENYEPWLKADKVAATVMPDEVFLY